MDTLAHGAPVSAGATESVQVVLPFAALDRSSLLLAGGKAANLGELWRAGFPVPPGFCVTAAAYADVADSVGLAPIVEELARTAATDTARIAALAGTARSLLLAAAMPAALGAAIEEAYRALAPDGTVPVAVRSSATAEDLPGASFAGQQDTYLNVVGADALLDAVRRCWASLWTERAAIYRATNDVDQRTVRLAVVVQRMVDAAVAGILFTANPVTGRRGQAVIDASPGLGEAIVSGAVNPDHFVVDVAGEEVVERRLGDKRVAITAADGGGTARVAREGGEGAACLSDAQLLALARLGRRVEAHYGASQDIEWAIDAAGVIWLTQARPITTLFPLPRRATAEDELRVYFSFNVAQGVYRPLTPMGIQAFRLFAASAATVFGLPPRDPLLGPSFLVEAAGRLFLDVTSLLRSSLGRKVFLTILGQAEARSEVALGACLADPRLAPRPVRPARLARSIVRAAATTRLPARIAVALLAPSRARQWARGLARSFAQVDVPSSASSEERLIAVERQLLSVATPLLRGVAGLAAGLLGWRLAGVLLGDLASTEERDALLRGLPYNPTTEMDLKLWALARHLRTDDQAAHELVTTPAAQLAVAYRARTLSPALQRGLGEFLRVYGHRGIAEIDLGLPRWSEDPTHLLGVLANYLRLDDPAAAPDVQFRTAAQQADEMVIRLVERARGQGTPRARLRALLLRWMLRRTRLLMGLREMPKFAGVTLLGRARAQLWPVGQELADAGRLLSAEDVFWLTIREARDGIAGADLRALVVERRAAYARELRRRHVPRLLLSDGTEPEAALPNVRADGALQGTPASAGVVTAPARVILDPTGARLEPGEILVAPSADPGWTPLFLTAGGLVMEMGGPMSHGAVVAREYGIPAVVGVAGAVERIRSGQRITVDGGAGTIVLTPDTA